MPAQNVEKDPAFPKEVKPAGGAGAREHVRRRVDATSLRTSNHPGEVVYPDRRGTHRIMPPSRPKAGAFLGVFQFRIQREGRGGRVSLGVVAGAALSDHEVRDARAPYQSSPPHTAVQNSFATFPSDAP